MAICGPFPSFERTVLKLLAVSLLSYIMLLLYSFVEWYKMNRFNQMENMRESELVFFLPTANEKLNRNLCWVQES